METIEELRYSPEQIFCGLQSVWRDVTGSIPPSMEKQIFLQMKETKSWDGMVFLDIILRIERLFGVDCTREEWDELFVFQKEGMDAKTWEEQIAPHLTFGALVEFIRKRIPGVSLGPQTVFGMTSQRAGAFLGIENTVKQMGLIVPAFGPSTDIRDRFRGPKLEEFYQRLQWMSCNHLPPLRTTLLTVIRHAILVIGSLCSFILFFACLGKFQEFLMLGSVVLISVTLILARLINLRDNRLPVGIQTFNDLATLLAGSKAN